MSQFRQPVLFRWNSPGRYEFGRWVPGRAIERDVLASVQPVTMQDIADMPEGERHGQMVKVYTADAEIPVHQFSQDRVTFAWGGFEWVVIADECHCSGVIEHRKLVARRVVTEQTP